MLCSSAKFGNGVSIGLIDEIDAKKIRHRKSFRQTAFPESLLSMSVVPMSFFAPALQSPRWIVLGSTAEGGLQRARRKQLSRNEAGVTVTVTYRT
jgi:hypothetical protein